jgi:hypothetical protein
MLAYDDTCDLGWYKYGTFYLQTMPAITFTKVKVLWITFRNDMEVIFKSLQLSCISIIHSPGSGDCDCQHHLFTSDILDLPLRRAFLYSHDDLRTAMMGECTCKGMKQQYLCSLSNFIFVLPPQSNAQPQKIWHHTGFSCK